jgi:hypothetical protein
MRLCFVLLADIKPLTAVRFEKALKEFPELGAVTWLSSSREGTTGFSVGGINVLAALMPMPVPDGEADGATDRSLSGLDGSWTLPEHRAHLVVVQQGPKRGDLEELSTFTRVVASVVRATDAVGVYWGEGGATHHPEFVVNIAHSELPLPVWVGVSVADTSSGKELVSIGMRQLGLPDLLLTTAKVDGEVFEFFYDLLAYVARRGKKLPEGDAVGRTEKEKLKVRYVPSPLDPQDEVWSVALPAPASAKKAAAKKKKVAKKPAKKKPAAKKKKKR